MGSDDPYFFLSYARQDRESDKHGVIQAFYADLAKRLRGLTGSSADPFAYLDTSMESGVHWPDEVAEALRTCRVFVPMLSPMFFSRPICGQEWTIFSERLEEHAPGADLIQPVLLYSRDDVVRRAPQLVAELNYGGDKYPDVYYALGLDGLVRLREEVAYEQFLVAFAATVRAAVDAHPLPPAVSVRPLGAVVPAFPEASKAGAAPGAPVSMTEKGAKYVRLVAVVADKGEFGDWRGTLEPYSDDGPLEWQPFHPDVADPVGDIVTSVVGTENLRILYDVADDRVTERIAAAVEAGNIVAVVADGWTLLLQHYVDRVRALDPAAGSHCVIVIPQSPHDCGREEERELAVKVAFESRGATPNPDVLLYPVSSLAELRKVLGPALVNAQARINNNRANYRRLTEDAEQLYKPEIQNTAPGAAQ